MSMMNIIAGKAAKKSAARPDIDKINLYRDIADAVRRFQTNDKTQIAALTNSSYPTASKVLGNFIKEQGMTEEILLPGGKSIKVPRGKYAHFLGIHIGATDSKAALIDYSLASVQESDRELFEGLKSDLDKALRADGHSHTEEDDLVKKTDALCCYHTEGSVDRVSFFIREVLRLFIAKHDERAINLAAIGLTFPTIISNEKIVFAPNVRELENMSIKGLIGDELCNMIAERGIVLSFEHDTQASVIYEKEMMYRMDDELYKKQNVVCVYVGTGIGMGIVLNGQLYRGTTCSAGETGHSVAPRISAAPVPIVEEDDGIDPAKVVCSCGRSNCLETCFRRDVFGCLTINSYYKYTTREKLSEIQCVPSNPQYQVLKEYLGYIMNIAINQFNADIIVMTGRITRIPDLPSQYEIIKDSSCIGFPAAACKVINGSNRTDAVAIGTAISAYMRLSGGGDIVPVRW